MIILKEEVLCSFFARLRNKDFKYKTDPHWL